MNKEIEFINFSPERVIEVAINILYGNDDEVLVVEATTATGERKAISAEIQRGVKKWTWQHGTN